jgi:hypothetical protein
MDNLDPTVLLVAGGCSVLVVQFVIRESASGELKKVRKAFWRSTCWGESERSAII